MGGVGEHYLIGQNLLCSNAVGVAGGIGSLVFNIESLVAWGTALWSRLQKFLLDM